MDNSIPKRPSFALLGSTGKTGQEVLRQLLTEDFGQLKVYARSQGKLLSMFPSIESDSRIKTCIGAIDSQALMQELLSDIDTIICTTGSDGMAPDTILQDSARSIVTALKALRDRDTAWRRPRLLFLSSASENERFVAARPRLVHSLISTAFQYGYRDLEVAQRLITADPSLVSVLLVQPNVLVVEEGTGHEISVHHARLACAYEDLGNAFVELAMDERYNELNQVGVSSRQGDRALRYVPIIFGKITKGLFVNFFPMGVQINRWLEGLWPWS